MRGRAVELYRRLLTQRPADLDLKNKLAAVLLALQIASGPPYADFQLINFHSWGLVLEKNWGEWAKLAMESNFNYSRQGSNPWVKTANVLVEMNDLLTYNLSLQAVGFYFHSIGPGPASYQSRSVSGGLSYRF